MAVVDNLEIRVKTSAEAAATGVNKLSDAMKGLKTSTAGSSGGVQKTTDAINNLKKSTGGAASAVTKVGNETKKAGQSAGSAAKGGFSNFISSFKRIAFYRFIRSIIKGITDGIKEGTQNLYQWSKAQQDANAAAFAQSMDKLSTSMQYLKNSVAAAVSPLINTLAPVIDFLVDKIVSFINILNQLFSALSGKSTWSKAIKQPKEYAAATAGASKAQQKWLAGFDELNNITTNEGGGGGSSTNYSGMFEQVEFDSEILDFLEKLKKKWDELGLTEKLKKLKEKWEEFKATGIFKKLAEIISGFVLVALEQVVVFLTDILQLLIDIFNGDWWAVLNDLKNLLVDLIYGPLLPLAAIIDAIFGTDFEKQLRAGIKILKDFDLGKWAKQALEDIKKFFSGLPKWYVDNVIMPTVSFFKKLRDGIIQALEEARKKVENVWVTVKTWFYDTVILPVQRFFGDLQQGIINVFNSAWSSVKNTWSTVKAWFNNNVILPIKRFFTDLKNNITNAFSSAWTTIKNVWGAVSGWFENNIKKPIVDKFESIRSTIYAKMAIAWSSIRGIFDNAGSFFTGIWNTVKNTFTDIGAKFGSSVGRAISTAVNSAITWVENTINSIIRTINSVLNVARSFGYRGNGLSTVSFSRVQLYASGGLPETGELFIAREAGAEMVGSINGRTAVANNDQIVEGVANGVFNAIVSTGLVGMVGSIDRKAGSNGKAIFAPSVEAGRWISRSLAMYQTAGG